MAKRVDTYETCEYDGDRACAVEAFLSVLGGRWKGMILFHLLSGTKRFGELRRLLPHVTQRMLTAQLRELEKDGILSRKVYAQVPPRVEYTLTEFGARLEPIVELMGEWGDRYMTLYATKAEPALVHAVGAEAGAKTKRAPAGGAGARGRSSVVR